MNPKEKDDEIIELTDEELDEIFKDHKAKVDAFFSSLPAKESE